MNVLISFIFIIQLFTLLIFRPLTEVITNLLGIRIIPVIFLFFFTYLFSAKYKT